MNATDLTPFLLLLLLGVTLGVGITMTVLLQRHRTKIRHFRRPLPVAPPVLEFSMPGPLYISRPSRWMAIRSTDLCAVQKALELHNPKPCSWQKALAGDERLFIAPPVKSWILIFGSDLPDPGEDIDLCFHFIMALSRKIGHAQLFSASRVLYHHAWIRAEKGKVQRAYAWANRTLWNQGRRTTAERELDLTCFEYGEGSELGSWQVPDLISTNIDKVPLLASRWSLDPAAIDECFLASALGVTGEK